MINHLCELPNPPTREHAGLIWYCPSCGSPYRAITVWSDWDTVYTACRWKRLNGMRRWWRMRRFRAVGPS